MQPPSVFSPPHESYIWSESIRPGHFSGLLGLIVSTLVVKRLHWLRDHSSFRTASDTYSCTYASFEKFSGSKPLLGRELFKDNGPAGRKPFVSLG